MREFLEPFMGETITAIVVAVVAWFSRGKMQKAETKNAEANAISAMQKAYDIYVDHNNQKMQDLENELLKLKKELDKKDTYWKGKYNALKKEFNDYKKTHP